MESQPQNPEFTNNPENFHSCAIIKSAKFLESQLQSRISNIAKISFNAIHENFRIYSTYCR